jgi:HEAT repeat protein
MAGPIFAEDGALDSLMYHNPELPRPKIAHVFPDNLLPLWLVALRRTEVDYQIGAALTIAQAHKDGLRGLEPAVEPLLEVLKRPDQIKLVRLAAAQALIELDARPLARQLLELARIGDHDLRDLIEPALANWKYRPVREDWLERLRLQDTSNPDRVLAIRGLAVLQDNDAASLLALLVKSRQASWTIRLEAARALGLIKTSGLEPDARQLVADMSPEGTNSRLAAASLLRHHQGDEAVQLLLSLARDPEPAVVRIALERLLEIDAKLALPAIISILASSDAKVRSLGVETLFREATVPQLPLLADKLDDPHPDVRIKARQSLKDLTARPDLRETVIREGLRMLQRRNWRGLEQAAILLGQLEHKPAAGRLVELLKFERPEVFIAAAWGLRRLAVPETLPKALDHFQTIMRLARVDPKMSREHLLLLQAWDQQLSQLTQFMGQSRYRPIETALRDQVPRRRNPVTDAPVIGQETRAASIWALSLIYEGKAEPQLVRQFEERLNDIPRFDPGEDTRVRWMSAVALGRMKSKGSLDSLKRFHFSSPTLDPVSHACGWAIQQITGETPPPPGTVEFSAGTFKNWLRSLPEPKPGG